MLNPDLTTLNDWMFGKLNNLLSDIKRGKESESFLLNIGEPQLSPPEIVKETINKYHLDWRKYTPSNGLREFRESVAHYISRRYPNAKDLLDIDKEITAVPGTRAPLHQVGWIVRKGTNKQTSLVTNPFYHAWRAGAVAAGTKIVWMDANKSNNYLPNPKIISQKILDDSALMYICTPSNPQGTSGSIEWLIEIINLCRKHKILLCVDECYADIYRNNSSPPAGTLEALEKIGEGCNGVVVFHSLSKRSSVPGLRCGFMAGDHRIIGAYNLLTSNGGVCLSFPQLKAGEALYMDDKHVQINRSYYDKNFLISKNILNHKTPSGGFFVFKRVKDDLIATKHLWKNFGVKVMPGSFMAANSINNNPGSGFLRIALVHDDSTTKKALNLVSKGLEEL